MKVSLLRRHRHICEMRRLHAATFLSLPVGLSLGLETPSGCWASSIPPQLHLLGQFDPLGMKESSLWGKEDLAGSRPPPAMSGTGGTFGYGEPGAAYGWLAWHMVRTVVLSPPHSRWIPAGVHPANALPWAGERSGERSSRAGSWPLAQLLRSLHSSVIYFTGFFCHFLVLLGRSPV